jgi:hypothetical protein
MVLLAFAFAAAWFVTGAMAAHLPGLLERAGSTHVQALAPLLFGLLLDRMGAAVIVVSAGLCLASCVALLGPRAVHADQSGDVV